MRRATYCLAIAVLVLSGALPRPALAQSYTPKSIRFVSTDSSQHLDTAEVARAFDRPGLVQERPSTVGELQPWPHEATWRVMRRWMAAGILGLLLLLVVFGLRPTRVLVDQSLSPEELLATPVDTTPGGDQVRSFLARHPV